MKIAEKHAYALAAALALLVFLAALGLQWAELGQDIGQTGTTEGEKNTQEPRILPALVRNMAVPTVILLAAYAGTAVTIRYYRRQIRALSEALSRQQPPPNDALMPELRHIYETVQRTRGQLADSDKRLRQAVQREIDVAQEKERSALSRELHDSVGQCLYSIAVGLKIFKQFKMDADTSRHLLELEKLTGQVMDEIKSISVRLRPTVLDDLGLIPAIRSYLASFEQMHNIFVDRKLPAEERRYDFAVESALYRIFQEAVSNALKHADTYKMEVCLEEKEGALHLTVRDFGRGTAVRAPGAAASGPGSGLGKLNMRERAEMLGGTFSFHSEQGEGTTVRVVIPI